MRKRPKGNWLVILAGCCLWTISTWAQQGSTSPAESAPAKDESMLGPPPAPIAPVQVKRAEPATTGGGNTSSPKARARDASRATSPVVFAIRGGDCTLIDFEDLGDNEPIGEITGAITVTFSQEWLSLIDADAGGSGDFANEPSPDTIAIISEEAGPINFSQGVRYIELYYVGEAVVIPVTLNAWSGLDGGGDLLDSQQGHTKGNRGDGADCAGDPNGAFCLFDRIVLIATGDDIRSINISGAVPNFIGFDNMTFCTASPIMGACCQPNGDCAETTLQNCDNQSGRYHGDHTQCRDFNCRLGSCCDEEACSLVEPQDCAGSFDGLGTNCDPNPCVGACCMSGADTGCGVRPGDCALTSGPDCEAEGGDFLGLGTECGQDVLIVKHNGPGDQWSPEMAAASTCSGSGDGCVDCANNYYDPWVTAQPIGGGNCEDFSHEDTCPLPANFFGPGSEPFAGEVCFKGDPLGEQQVPGCGDPIDFGAADTIIRRFADPFEACDAPRNAPVEVEIVMERLSLVSCEPISVHFAGEGGCTRDPAWQCDGDTDGDGQVNPVDSGLVQASFGSTEEADLCQFDLDCDGQINPVDSGIVQSLFGTCKEPRAACDGGRDELWDVRVEVLSSEGQPSGGTLTASKQYCNGGVFDSTMRFCPTFVFRKVDDPNIEVRIDFCAVCDPDGIAMNATSVPWVTEPADAQGLVSPVCSDFHAGLQEKNPRSDCNCDDDGIHDDCEPDSDGDGVVDDCDNCPGEENQDQADRDHDGIGDLCDVCPGDPDDDCLGGCCTPGGPCDWNNGMIPNGGRGRSMSPPLLPNVRLADDFRFDKPCSIRSVHVSVTEDRGWEDGGILEVCVYENMPTGRPGPIVECISSGFRKVAKGNVYFSRDNFDYFVGGLSIPLDPGTYWLGVRNPNGSGERTNTWMPTDGGSDGPGLGGAWLSNDAGSTWEEAYGPVNFAFELNADVAGGDLNWDNNIQPDGMNARAISPPRFPNVRVADDFNPAAPSTLRKVRASFVEDAGWSDGGRISVLIYRDDEGHPGPVIAGANTTFTRTSTGDSYFGRDHYEYLVEGLSIGLAAGPHWLGLRNPRGSGSGTNYWMTSDGGSDGVDTGGGYFSLDAGATWRPEGSRVHHAFELGIGVGGCLDTTEDDCADRGGDFHRGEACEEGPCLGACCEPRSAECEWDNRMWSDGFGARAVSPPGFPDIRVADDIRLDTRCTITDMNVHVIEDEGWIHGGSVTVEIRADSGGSPGEIAATHVGGFARVARGRTYFGRDDYDYKILSMAIDLPAGDYWVGFRNPLGSGADSNYWLTSEGGRDGYNSSTGYFSLDAGDTWHAEGAGWHHSFEINMESRTCIQTTEPECSNRRGSFALGVDCASAPCVEGVCCFAYGMGEGWDNGLQPDGVNFRAMSPPEFPDNRVADDFTFGEYRTISTIRANVIEDSGWTPGDEIFVGFRRGEAGPAGDAFLTFRVGGGNFQRIATGDTYFGRDGYDYWIQHNPVRFPPGTYWLTLRNHLGRGTGSNYWMTSDGGADGPGSSTGYVSLDAGETWLPEGEGWHHAFEVKGVDPGECAVMLSDNCISEGGSFQEGLECNDDPCRLCDDCEDESVETCEGSETCFDCVTETEGCVCVENDECAGRTPCPNGQSDCPIGQFCCTNSCCEEPVCFDPCGRRALGPIPPEGGRTGMYTGE